MRGGREAARQDTHTGRADACGEAEERAGRVGMHAKKVGEAAGKWQNDDKYQ